MAKLATKFICQNCGASFGKWAGHCDLCNEWNTIVQEESVHNFSKTIKNRKGSEIELFDLLGKTKNVTRFTSGITEFDRVCGGGLTHGSTTLVCGDPGIGKSTLLLQIMGKLANETNCIYISGEESVDQIRKRASRLGLLKTQVRLASATNVNDLTTTLTKNSNKKVVVIDSIQTMFVESVDSSPGTISQVRSSAQELIFLAKNLEFAIILVGHVTKEGNIAGPKILEHMVDTVLYFEGEQNNQFRILRGIKNRFGPTNEIGVFEMTKNGLIEIENPSALFLAQRHSHVSGAAVFSAMEGTRPVLLEIQALVAPGGQNTPRRSAIGWDPNRLGMIIAVLEARCGLSFRDKDVYLNVVGGLRVSERASDLAVAAAIISAMKDFPVPHNFVVFGEIGLSGEVRAVNQTEFRLKEAEKLGFKGAFLPKVKNKTDGKNELNFKSSLSYVGVGHIKDLLEFLDQNCMSPQLKTKAS